MSIYKCLSTNQEYAIGDYKIVPLRYEDIFSIKEWRNTQIDILRQKELLSDENQIQYYKDIFNVPNRASTVL
jgi:hypothetical protein